jgi:SAM-dependent methyltransferase
MTVFSRQTLRRSRALQGLRRHLWRARFRLLRRFSPAWRAAPDGIPVPPEELRFLISGIPGYPVPDFLDMGKLCAGRIREGLGRHGVDMAGLGAILDFGCGCGRTIRHFASLNGTKVHGTDYNPLLIRWCRPNLAFADFGLNQLAPPLGYPDGAFGLVYAFSVFTHLPEPLQFAWMEELTRILRPGGYLVFSTQPERSLPDDESVRRRFREGELVVLNGSDPGSNACTVFHPQAYVKETLARGYELLEFVPDGVGQDFWLFRKSSGAAPRVASSRGVAR